MLANRERWEPQACRDLTGCQETKETEDSPGLGGSQASLDLLVQQDRKASEDRPVSPVLWERPECRDHQGYQAVRDRWDHQAHWV